MSRRRMLRIVGGILIAFVAAYLTLGIAASKNRINSESVQRIRKGMSLPEVEQILGAPPGNYSSHEATIVRDGAIMLIGFEEPAQVFRSVEWASDETVVTIWLDKKDRVVTLHQGKVVQSQTSFLDRLFNWFTFTTPERIRD
jgi:hypothetical protein